MLTTARFTPCCLQGQADLIAACKVAAAVDWTNSLQLLKQMRHAESNDVQRHSCHLNLIHVTPTYNAFSGQLDQQRQPCEQQFFT